MKFFILLIIFALVLAFIYARLRPYIRMARRVLGFIRDAKSVGTSQPANSTRSETNEVKKLARCESCGTWVPATNALTLRSGLTFCSNDCLENRSTAESAKRKFGSK